MLTKDNNSKRFEISLVVRDANGQPTDKMKSFASDNSYAISQFCARNSMHGKPKNKNQRIPDAKEADKILKAMSQEEA